MNILEIPVFGDTSTETEKLFSLLTEKPLRNFHGLNFGNLKLDNDLSVYLYFLNQEKENYFYLWDLIIPHSICSIVICDWRNEEAFKANLKAIEHIKNRFKTPLQICAIKTEESAPAFVKQSGINFDDDDQILFLDTQNKESAKKILLKAIESSGS